MPPCNGRIELWHAASARDHGIGLPLMEAVEKGGARAAACAGALHLAAVRRRATARGCNASVTNSGYCNTNIFRGASDARTPRPPPPRLAISLHIAIPYRNTIQPPAALAELIIFDFGRKPLGKFPEGKSLGEFQ